MLTDSDRPPYTNHAFLKIQNDQMTKENPPYFSLSSAFILVETFFILIAIHQHVTDKYHFFFKRKIISFTIFYFTICCPPRIAPFN